MLDENYINRIIFDFGKTEFMDSSGIGVLLNRYKQMAASRGTVTYYGAGPRVVRILEMGGLVRLIRGFKDRKKCSGKFIKAGGWKKVEGQKEQTRQKEHVRLEFESLIPVMKSLPGWWQLYL